MSFTYKHTLAASYIEQTLLFMVNPPFISINNISSILCHERRKLAIRTFVCYNFPDDCAYRVFKTQKKNIGDV